MEKKENIRATVMVGFFAAITFLGIQAFRIPLPAVVGTPFLHFGHIFVVMGVLLLGGKKGAISGTLGLVIFDLLNGYAHAIPEVFLGTIVKCLIIGALMNSLRKKAGQDDDIRQHHVHKEYTAAVVCSVTYGALNVVIEFITGMVNMLIVGSGYKAAMIGSLTSLPATVINAIFMIVAVSLIYVPVRSIYTKAMTVPI
ncbi:MAG: ECF transporter S component [Lachnospiraceae bacterium]